MITRRCSLLCVLHETAASVRKWRYEIGFFVLLRLSGNKDGIFSCCCQSFGSFMPFFPVIAEFKLRLLFNRSTCFTHTETETRRWIVNVPGALFSISGMLASIHADHVQIDIGILAVMPTYYDNIVILLEIKCNYRRQVDGYSLSTIYWDHYANDPSVYSTTASQIGLEMEKFHKFFKNFSLINFCYFDLLCFSASLMSKWRQTKKGEKIFCFVTLSWVWQWTLRQLREFQLKCRKIMRIVCLHRTTTINFHFNEIIPEFEKSKKKKKLKTVQIESLLQLLKIYLCIRRLTDETSNNKRN